VPEGAVLVVDDDAGMVETLADILAARRYRVATAQSGAAAVARLRGDRYDVVLMDIQMPGLNGVDALRAMRALAPDLSVIMMTAYTRHELVEEARQATALEVLTKPLDLDRVLGLIDGAVRRAPRAGA
jgi:DNA-binding NtrC family response regulator